MDYYVYPLRFVTPVHFGDTAQGGTLEDISIMLSSDSFFGACCSELSHDAMALERFVDYVATGNMIMSSLFPYINTGESLELYLPVPLMRIDKQEQQLRSFEDTKKEATKQKQQKKCDFIRATHVQQYSELIKSDTVLTTPTFVDKNTITQVNMRGNTSRPFHVGNYRFTKEAGLYVIVGFKSDEAKTVFDELIVSLGYSGIGGKRSSGYGKFELSDDPIELDEDGIYEDDKALYEMIHHPNPSCQMCISICVPQGMDAIRSLKQGHFKLKKRSGFVVTSGADIQSKRNSYYAIAEGSVCETPIAGAILTIQGENLPHPVYRNGCGLWIGVD